MVRAVVVYVSLVRYSRRMLDIELCIGLWRRRILDGEVRDWLQAERCFKPDVVCVGVDGVQK